MCVSGLTLTPFLFTSKYLTVTDSDSEVVNHRFADLQLIRFLNAVLAEMKIVNATETRAAFRGSDPQSYRILHFARDTLSLPTAFVHLKSPSFIRRDWSVS